MNRNNLSRSAVMPDEKKKRKKQNTNISKQAVQQPGRTGVGQRPMKENRLPAGSRPDTGGPPRPDTGAPPDDNPPASYGANNGDLPPGLAGPSSTTPGNSVAAPTKVNGDGLAEMQKEKRGPGVGERPKQTTNVAEIAAEIANQNSAIMRQAKTQGKQVAAQRGMLNSSMMGQAMQAAVLDRAIPMAQQEAAQRFEEAQTRLTHRQTLRQLKVEQDFAKAEGIRERRHATKQLMAELRSEEQLALLDSETRKQLIEMETASREKLARMDIRLADRERAADMFLNVQAQYQDALRTIMSNPDLSAADRNAYIKSMQKMLDAQIIAIEDMVGTDINFETGAFDEEVETPDTPVPLDPTNPNPGPSPWRQ